MANFNLENKLETRKHSIFTLAQLFLHRSFAMERFGWRAVSRDCDWFVISRQ
ncbi:MAG: hypothetical protein QG625_1218, partial [Cyanobacteriota bacterium erpe_2018_sw_39hr_WHONDRS-SW48-000098_B_bin.30]|nr:hypothetical protein [Cyanobacteriota bacterium erpe_2018_sw_39hr_WHONDRS-SW48-000098_B_bin.30]